MDPPTARSSALFSSRSRSFSADSTTTDFYNNAATGSSKRRSNNRRLVRKKPASSKSQQRQQEQGRCGGGEAVARPVRRLPELHGGDGRPPSGASSAPTELLAWYLSLNSPSSPPSATSSLLLNVASLSPCAFRENMCIIMIVDF
jgi:hypothetical protein